MKKFNIKTGLLLLSITLILPAVLQAQTPTNDVPVLNALQFFWDKTGFANFQINNLIMIVMIGRYPMKVVHIVHSGICIECFSCRDR
jgi:hypothetical protein